MIAASPVSLGLMDCLTIARDNLNAELDRDCALQGVLSAGYLLKRPKVRQELANLTGQTMLQLTTLDSAIEALDNNEPDSAEGALRALEGSPLHAFEIPLTGATLH